MLANPNYTLYGLSLFHSCAKLDCGAFLGFLRLSGTAYRLEVGRKCDQVLSDGWNYRYARHSSNPGKDMTMSELNLILSECFDTEDAAAVHAALNEHLSLGQPQPFIRRSADPTLISFIQLVGDAAAWLPLAAASTFFVSYLSTLGKHAGDATRDGIASLFKRKEVKPLADVATTLATAANKADGEVVIVVGLNIPNYNFGTVVIIKNGNPADVAYNLAAFVIHAEELSKTMLAEVAAGRAPLGPAVVEVQDDGSLLVKWHSQADFKEHKIRIKNDAE